MSFLPPLSLWTIVGIIQIAASTALLATYSKATWRRTVIGVVLALLGTLCTYIGPALDAREESKQAQEQLEAATRRFEASLEEAHQKAAAEMDAMSANITAAVRTEIVKSNDVAARAALEELQEKIVRVTKGLPPIVTDADGAGSGEGQPPSAPIPELGPAAAPKPGRMLAYEVGSATIGKESNGYVPYATVELSIHNRGDEPVRVLAARSSFTIRTDGGPNFIPTQRDWGLSQCPSTHVAYCKNDDRADPLYVDIGPNATARFNVTMHTTTRPTSADMKVLAQLVSGSLSGSLFAKYPERRGAGVDTIPVSVSSIAFKNSLAL